MLTGIGYEGREPGELIEALRADGIAVVVDVRLNPVSRKRGFSKGPLRASLEQAGIAYVHERSLGTPPEERAGFRGKGLEAARARTRERLAGTAADALDRVRDLAAEQRVAVLCFERDEERCHRRVVIEMVADANQAMGQNRERDGG